MLSHDDAIFLGIISREREYAALENQRKTERCGRDYHEKRRREKLSLKQKIKEHCNNHSIRYPPSLEHVYWGDIRSLYAYSLNLGDSI